MTQGGTEDASWNFPSQGPDGKTVVSHRDSFEGGQAPRPLPLRRRRQAHHRQRDARLLRRDIPVYPISSTWTGSRTPSPTATPTAASPARRLPRLLADVLRQPGRVPEPTRRASRTPTTRPSTARASCPRTPAARSRPARRRRGAVHELLPGLDRARRGYSLSRAEVSPAQNMVAIEWSRSPTRQGHRHRAPPGHGPERRRRRLRRPPRRAEQPHVLARRHADGVAGRRGRQGRRRPEPRRRHRDLHAHRPAARHLRHAAAADFGGADVGASGSAGGGTPGAGSGQAAPAAGARAAAPRPRSSRSASCQGHARRVRQGLTIKVAARAGRAIDASAGLPAKVGSRCA